MANPEHLKISKEPTLANKWGVSVIKENPSMRWRIETKRFLNFADALTAGVIQV